MGKHWAQGNHWRPFICGTCLLAAIFMSVSLVTNTWAIKRHNYGTKSVTFKYGLWDKCEETMVKHGVNTSSSSNTKTLTYVYCKEFESDPGFIVTSRKILLVACIGCYATFIYAMVLIIFFKKSLYGWMTVPSLLTALLCTSIFIIMLKNILAPPNTTDLKDYVIGWSFYHFVFGYSFLLASMFSTLKDKGRRQNNTITPTIRTINATPGGESDNSTSST